MFKPISLLLRRNQRRWLYPLVGTVTAIALWLGTPIASQAVPLGELIFRGIQIVQLSSVSPRQEMQIGAQIDQGIKQKVRVSQNQRLTSYVNYIGQRLARNNDRSQIKYTFQVVEDKSLNAFATTGGFVYIHTGVIAAADNEAELASVIAHEIGHIEGKHLLKQMKEMAIAQGAAAAAGINRNQVVQMGVELALRRPRSREHEFDADRRGLVLLQEAGYDQRGMVSFMEKLLKQGGSMPTFLSTHPNTANRIAAIEQQIDPRQPQGDGLSTQEYQARLQSF